MTNICGVSHGQMAKVELSVGLHFTALFMRGSLSSLEASLDAVGAKVCTILARDILEVAKGRLGTPLLQVLFSTISGRWNAHPQRFLSGRLPPPKMCTVRARLRSFLTRYA